MILRSIYDVIKTEILFQILRTDHRFPLGGLYIFQGRSGPDLV